MTKKDLSDLVSKEANIATAKAQEATAAVFNSLFKSLAKGKQIYIRGFGSFRIVKRKAKVGRNILAKKEVKIPERNAVKFVASPDLKAAVKKTIKN